MLYSVKSLLKVQLNEYHFLFTLLAKIYVFKSRGEAILDVSVFYEAILILVNDIEDDSLKFVVKKCW
jgi:hypothetical protein